MCILCVVQRWSRRVASMLPYLVIPLMLLWALSHFLPPSFRFEATSPRIACAAVLLMTLLWYEFLLPRLSAWRARRSARLRELRREQALELQKLRKTATRRCRNCLSPYRDQNPGGGGRFMCSNCGHVSKRPVLELPGHAGNFGEKGGWFCSQFLSNETGNGYWLEDSNNNSNNNGNRCSAQENAFPLGCKIGNILSFFCLVFKWVCRRVFGFGSSGENSSSDNDSKRNKQGENGGNLQESKTDKARRKAEEKRLARLEKEMLEEEERKQREEVARLVEERRKLRDEKLEAEEKSKGVTPIGEREGKKEHDKKRQERERRRESNNQKDKMSNKSNSDCEEFEKKGRNVGTSQRTSKASHQQNGGGNNNINNRRKYFGGNFRGFTGASFFGGSNQTSNAANNTTSVNKGVNKTSLNAASINNNQSHVVKREGHTGTGTVHNAVPNGDDKNAETKINRPAQTEQQPPQQPPPPKKAWHQLFKRSLPVSVSPSPTPQPLNPQPLNPQTLNPQTLIPQTLNPNMDTYIAPPNNYFNPQHPVFKPQSLLPFPVYNPIITTNPNLSFHQSSTSLIFPPVPRSPPVEPESFEDPDALSLLGNLPLGFIPPIARPKSNNNSNDRVVRDGPGAWTLWGAPLAQNALGSVGGEKSGEYLMNSSRQLMSDKRAVAPPERTTGKAADPNGESLFLPHNLMGRQLDGAKSPDISPTQHWSKKEWMVNGEATSSIPASPRGESLFSTDPVVQSLWSFNPKDSK